MSLDPTREELAARYVPVADALGSGRNRGAIYGPAPDPARLAYRPRAWECPHIHKTSHEARNCAASEIVERGWA